MELHDDKQKPPSVQVLASGMIGAVKKYVADTLAPIASRLAAVEFKTGALALHFGKEQPEAAKEIETLMARIKALEDRPPLSYGGTWSEGQTSKAGVFYTYGGAIWYCHETTDDRPSTSKSFQLACKRGADGKDATAAKQITVR